MLGCRKTNHTLRRRRGNPVVPLGARKFSVRIAKRFQVVVHQPTRGSGPEDGCRILSISSSYSRSGATQTVSFPFLAPPQNFFFLIFEQFRLQCFRLVQTTDVSPETGNKHLQSHRLPSRMKTKQKQNEKQKNKTEKHSVASVSRLPAP